MHVWGKLTNAEVKKDTKSSTTTTDGQVACVNNHMYFYEDVTFNSALNFNKSLNVIIPSILDISNKMGTTNPEIWLHICSGGGYVSAGIAMMDSIQAINDAGKIKINTIAEGMVASSATFVSCAGHRRLITPNSNMLIHQLSSMHWGNYEQLKDHQENTDLLMKMIKRIYTKYTKLKSKDLDEILKRDLYWDSKTCLEHGLVDEIV